MPKNRDLPLADWEITTKLPGGPIISVIIRATTLDNRGDAVVLLDNLGRELFSAPAGGSVVKRVSDEDRQAMREAAAEAEKAASAPQTRGGYRGGMPAEEVAPPADVPLGSMSQPEPAPLPRRSTRTKTR